jgi:hypothetical protein
LIELARATVGDPITGVDDEVWCQFLKATEGFEYVFIVDFWADVQVADLGQSTPLKFARETRDRQQWRG